MLKNVLKPYLKKLQNLKGNKSLASVNRFLHDPNLWHLNRYSVATAFSIGLAVALIPLPFQMLMAAILSIFFKANLPIAVGLTFVSNPFTTPFIAYICYEIGILILGRRAEPFHFEPTIQWLFGSIGLPFLLGSLILAIIVAILSNITIRLIWRYMTIKHWNLRKGRRHFKKGRKRK